jgi:hypothetical protein
MVAALVWLRASASRAILRRSAARSRLVRKAAGRSVAISLSAAKDPADPPIATMS